MFGKKTPPPTPAKPQTAPAAPPKPAGWLVQALTTNYGVVGRLEPASMPLLGFLNMSAQSTVALTAAQLTALEPQALIAEAAPAEISIVKTTLIALIPGDEPSTASARTQLPPRTERAVLYAGPFVIRASLGMMGEMPLRHLFNTGAGTFVIATDIEVRCQILGTVFAPQVAPVALLNKTLIQVYHAS